MMIEVQCKVTGIETANNCCCVYRVNKQLPYDKAQTPESEAEKCQNSHNCVGKTFKVEGVGGLSFARSNVWAPFTLFVKPDDFF